MPKLLANRYGKGRVRVLKVLRNGATHRIKDLTVKAMLEGDLESSYTKGDNSKVVPTDTIRNTINALALEHLGDQIERFGVVLGQHFLQFPQIHQVTVEILERDWHRLEVNGKPHSHSFSSGGETRMFSRVTMTRDKSIVQSGIRDLVILKSTQSGFEGYPRDKFTTLKETSDRILGTSFSATWDFAKDPGDYRVSNSAIMTAMLEVFAENFSPSAQATLYQMGEAALAVCVEIDSIELAMPNRHCVLIDLSPFGLENRNEVFLPIDEPHGQIEATVCR
ncbi:MAG: factor-independent urate hydroxylase [Chthoniobacterales bacterium]